MANVTENEKKVLEAIHDVMKAYDKQGEPGFSDVTLDDLEGDTDLSVQTLKGVLGSLIKKDYVHTAGDETDECSIYYITKRGQDAL